MNSYVRFKCDTFAPQNKKSHNKHSLAFPCCFDPDNEHGKFSYTWQAILQFGRLEYFNEEEYKQVLSTVLQGAAQDTYQEMARQGYPLKHMLDTFADLYAPRNTIEEDHEKEEKEED